MSYQAIGWVLRDAPCVQAQWVGVLMGLAEHADKHGCGSYPSAATLAEYARKSERQVRYDLEHLAEAKLIRPGDQTLVKKLPVNRRPVVYDLAMERTRALEVQSTAPLDAARGMQSTAPQGGMQSTAPQSAVDQGKHGEVQSTAPLDGMSLGCNAAQPGVQPTADKPSSKPPKAKNTAKHEVADALAAAFWERHKAATAQGFIPIRQIIRTALANGLPRDDVARALDKLAREGRPISGGTITAAIHEIKNPHGANGRPAVNNLPAGISPRDEHRYRR